MPSLVTRNNHSPQITGVELSGVPCESCHTTSAGLRLPSPPGRTANIGSFMPCVTKINPCRGHRAGDRAAADQIGQAAKAACRWPDRRRRAPARPSPPTPAGRCSSTGWASYTNRNFSRVAAVMRIVFQRSWPVPDRVRRRSSAKACPANRRTNLECRSRSPDRRKARGCWRGPTRSCSRRSPSASFAARIAGRRNRRPPDRRCRNAPRRAGRRSRAKGWRNCASSSND